MTHKEFIFWLKGIADSSTTPPTKKTWKIIQDKLNQIKGEETEEDKQPEIYIKTLKGIPKHVIDDLDFRIDDKYLLQLGDRDIPLLEADDGLEEYR